MLVGQDPPSEAVAGAIKASQDYSSGLMLAVYESGAGRLILNTLLIRENLGSHPAAERLLCNLLNHAASESPSPSSRPQEALLHEAVCVEWSLAASGQAVG